MAIIAATKTMEVRTMKTSNQKRLFVLLVQIFKERFA